MPVYCFRNTSSMPMLKLNNVISTTFDPTKTIFDRKYYIGGSSTQWSMEWIYQMSHRSILIQRWPTGDVAALSRCNGDGVTLWPDSFIMMTCNSLSPEITAKLFQGQTVQDHPDLVPRVFKCKLNQLLYDLTKENFFGKIVAFIYIIELQKRDLPHPHILLMLDSMDKPHIPADIDSIVCAKIPIHPELYDTIVSFMLHGPYDTANPNASYMQDDKCKKHFPKAFYDETLSEMDGYPIY